jgi:hypothetical protein
MSVISPDPLLVFSADLIPPVLLFEFFSLHRTRPTQSSQTTESGHLLRFEDQA